MINTGLEKKKVVLGMSGGVDSSVALMLLHEAGYEVIGVSLKYDTWGCSNKENVCCSKESFDLAKQVATKFKCKHFIIDVRKDFSENVIKYFTQELKRSRTPSPCVFCNPRVKYASLLNFADKVGAQYIATGHYARVSQAGIFSSQQTVLKRAKDLSKDQSYSLSFLTQSTLKRTIFPLGELTKQDVYDIASRAGFSQYYSKIKQSQDFCFVNNSDYLKFIKREINPKKGLIVDANFKQLGEHKGLALYTIGQRKGILLPGGPYYVIEKKRPNTLVVSRDKADSYTTKAILKPFNFIVMPDKKRISVLVKTRSGEKLHKALVTIAKDSLILTYPKKITQLVCGQIAVLYQKDICLGAGVINSPMTR